MPQRVDLQVVAYSDEMSDFKSRFIGCGWQGYE